MARKKPPTTTEECYILLGNLKRKKKIKLQKQRTAEDCDCSTYLQSCGFENGSWHRLWVCCCIRQSKFSRAISPFHIWRGLASYFSSVAIICFVCIAPAASPCIFSHLNFFFFHLITFSHPHTDVTGVEILTRHFCFAEHLIEYPHATSTLEEKKKKTVWRYSHSLTHESLKRLKKRHSGWWQRHRPVFNAQDKLTADLWFSRAVYSHITTKEHDTRSGGMNRCIYQGFFFLPLIINFLWCFYLKCNLMQIVSCFFIFISLSKAECAITRILIQESMLLNNELTFNLHCIFLFYLHEMPPGRSIM